MTTYHWDPGAMASVPYTTATNASPKLEAQQPPEAKTASTSTEPTDSQVATVGLSIAGAVVAALFHKSLPSGLPDVAAAVAGVMTFYHVNVGKYALPVIDAIGKVAKVGSKVTAAVGTAVTSSAEKAAPPAA